MSISDIDYLQRLDKQHSWIVISKDLQNGKKKAERAAILNNGVLAFYLARTVQRLKINEQAATIVWQWDKILTQRMHNENGLFQLPLNKGSKFKQL